MWNIENWEWPGYEALVHTNQQAFNGWGKCLIDNFLYMSDFDLTLRVCVQGYVRIILTIVACYWMFTDPLKAALSFTLSHTVLDDLDGIAARRFKQGAYMA